MRLGWGAFDEVEGAIGAEVGGEESIDGAAFDDGAFVDDLQADAFHEVTKVAHGHEVDIGSLVPFPGEGFGDGCASAAKNFHANAPVSKVWYDDEAAGGDAEHFREQSAGVTDLLEGLAEYGEVEGVAGDIVEALIEVGLDGREAALDDLNEVFLFDFDAEHIAAGFFVEAFEEPSVTAAEVDHAASASDVLHDEFVGEADGRVRNLVAWAL